MWSIISAGLGFSAAVAALAVDTKLVDKRDKSCDFPEQVPGTLTIGGNEGGPFCLTKWPSSNIIIGLESYSDYVSGRSSIQGLRVTYADGSAETVGRTDDAGAKTGKWLSTPGDFITGGWLAGNGIGNRLGAIHLEMHSKGTADLGLTDDAVKKNDLESYIGSGILIGISGKSGAEINNLELHFLDSSIDHIQLGHQQFTDDQGDAGLQLSQTKIHYYNGLSNSMSFGDSGGSSVTSTSTYSSSTTKSFGNDITFSFDVGYKGIVDAGTSTSLSWNTTDTTSKSNTITRTVSQAWQFAGTLGPGEGTDCTASSATGQRTFHYTQDVTVVLKNGKKITWNEPGQLDVTDYTVATHACVPNNQKDSAGFEPGKLTPV